MTKTGGPSGSLYKSVVLMACALLLAVPGGFCQQQKKVSAASLYQQGLEKQRSEDWYGASELFQEALDVNPSYGDAWFHLAQCAYELEDYELAVTYAENAEKYARNDTSVQNLRGMAYISLGRLDQARTVFQDVLDRFPNDVDARFGLAELDLFDGRLSSAEQIYKDALRRQGTNRKALLSLALVSAELGKHDTAAVYIDQALQYHSGDAGVHYLAAYLAARRGELKDAEYHARAAMQMNPDYAKAYSLLASILYALEQYEDVIDICDYIIGRDRNNATAWYTKGLSQYRKGDAAAAVVTWSRGIGIAPTDEVMRSAMELLGGDMLALEDERRSSWAAYHGRKAAEYRKQFLKSQVMYEYQRALKIDPLNVAVRTEYAQMLRNDGLNELYLEQLKFIQQNTAETAAANTTADSSSVKLSDTIEAYSSLLSDTLAKKWKVKPLYLDKIRWKLGIYYVTSPVQLLHSDSEWITAGMIAEMFSGVASTSVEAKAVPVSGYGEAFRDARAQGRDYFIIFSMTETGREVAIDADMYSARTGTKTATFSVFRTGNDKYANALRRLRQCVLEVLPIRGEVLARNGENTLLIDLGRADGVVKGTVFDVVRKGSIRTVDSGPGVMYDQKNVLGSFTVDTADEEISEGTFSRKGFFDRLNVADEVVVVSVPAGTRASGEEQGTAEQTSPAADAEGKAVAAAADPADLSVESLGLKRIPALVELIRNIY